MIKVITFNILCGGSGENSIDNRAPRVKELLSRYDADLIGFQEATPRWLEHLERDYGDAYEIFNHWRSETNHESTPMMWRKSRFTCLEKGYFWLSDTPDLESGGWDTMGCNRICMWAKLQDKQEGGSLVFLNTHYGFGEENQLKSGRLILDHIKAFGLPVILTADFNMFPDSRAYKLLMEELGESNAATVQDPRNTFHGFQSAESSTLIDFCFYSKDTIAAVTRKRMDELVDGQYPSDHYGVYSELEVHQKLHLITFNVKNMCHEPEERAKMLRRLLRRYDADVVGLQEVTPVFEKELAKIGRYEMALKYRAENEQEATPILWNKERFERVHQEFFWLSETPEVSGKGFGAQYIRIATLLVLRHKETGRKICCLNTHLDGGAAGEKAIALIREKLAPYCDMPVFVTGDFNMEIGSKGYRAMIEEFCDARLEAAPLDHTPTTNDFGDPMMPARIIDFVFFRGEQAKALSYRVIDERPQGKYISDHYGIDVSFLLD